MPNVYTFPREWYRFVSSSFNLRSIGIGARPTFKSTQKTTRLIEQFFQGDYILKPRVGPSAWQAESAFFSRLDGEANYFRIGDPLRCIPQYNRPQFGNIAPQEPFTDGTFFTDNTGWVEGAVPEYATIAEPARRGDKAVVIKGLPASLPALLFVGDLFEVQPNGIPSPTANLYQIAVPGGTDAEGWSGVEIRPRLRMNLAVGDRVVFNWPTTVMQLIDSDQAQLSREANVGSYGFSCVEHTG